MKRFYEQLCTAEAVLAAVLLVLMVVLIFLGGAMRTLGHPINWSTDAATCFFAWGCFLSADIAWRKNALMSIDIVPNSLPERYRRLLVFCNYAIICVFLAYVLVGGLYLSWISRERSFQGIPEISYSWVTMSLPVGAALLLLTTALKIRDAFRGRAAHAPRPADHPGAAV